MDIVAEVERLNRIMKREGVPPSVRIPALADIRMKLEQAEREKFGNPANLAKVMQTQCKGDMAKVAKEMEYHVNHLYKLINPQTCPHCDTE